MSYIKFTEAEKEKAKSTDIVSLLESHGEKLKRSGSEYEWSDNGQKVTVRGNLWYHQYEQEGGDAIDFVKKYYGKSYAEAVDFLLNGGNSNLYVSQTIQKQEKTLIVPERNTDMRRVFAYLTKRRGIDADILRYFVRERLIYEDSKYHNAVFVGKDTDGNIKHIHKRSTSFNSSYKGNEAGSKPEYSFHKIGLDNMLYIFESPIDMLSYISMNKENWEQHSYAACCGVGDRVLFKMLEDNPNINTVCLCLDSDEAGQTASQRIAEKLIELGYDYDVEIPHCKDWNDELLSLKIETEETVWTQQSL